MTSVIVDRRSQSGKSGANRQRLLRRLSVTLRRQVDTLLSRRKLSEMDQVADVTVPQRDLSESTFTLDAASGTINRVLPGNTQFRVGDLIPKPPAEGSGGDGDGSGEGGEDATDAFRLQLSREEFLNLLFDNLKLPELLKKELLDITEQRLRRGGVVRYGSPSSLSVLRTFRASLGRRIAAQGSATQERAEHALRHQQATDDGDDEAATQALDEAAEFERRAARVPFLDPVDLRHRSLISVPAPRTAAVMFCLMDVSGSMDETRKDLAKRFFTLLYLFLSRKYERVELVFIRHTDTAEEVDETTFFEDPRTGSTRVLAALQKMHEVVEERYPQSRYNIFGAQASDGDSFGNDPDESRDFLIQTLLPLSRYFVYAETNERSCEGSALWDKYRNIESPTFNMAGIRGREDVFPALVKLFDRER